MSEKKYSKATFKLLRGLRETTDDGELQLEFAKASTPSSSPRKQKKVIPVYGLPILAHCPKYGEFWRPKVISHEIVNVDDGKGNIEVRKGDTIDDSTGNCGARKCDTQEHADGKDVSVSDAVVCYYEKHDAYKSQPVSDIRNTPAAEKTVTCDLSEYTDPTYKILRGLRKLNNDLTTAYNALPTEMPVAKPPRVRVVPTYGQPVLVHCARYGTFRQWQLISHELVRPGQAAAEELVPEDVCVDQFAEEQQIIHVDDESYRRYKKTDTYGIVNANGNTENEDDTISASPALSPTDVHVTRPQSDDDDEDMDGIFGVYARSH